VRRSEWKKYTAKLYLPRPMTASPAPGQRVFSFKCCRACEFKDFDVWVKAGGPNRAYVETVPVESD